MRRLVLSAAALILVTSVPALADLCATCKNKMFITNIGKCAECKGTTSSGAFKLCKKCSAGLKQCQACRASLTPTKQPVAKSTGGPLVVTIDDSRKTLSLAAGAKIVIKLKGNPSTGYRWKLDKIDGDAVEKDGEIQFKQDQGADRRVGAGGMFEQKLKAVKPGKAEVKMLYRRGTSGSGRTFIVKFDVKSAGPKPVVFDETKQEATVEVGTPVEIRLKGNATTGFSWSVAKIEGDAVKQQGKVRYVPDKAPRGMVGSGGTAIATFKAVKAGKSIITLEYRRPWEKTKPAEKTYTAKVTVKAKAEKPADTPAGKPAARSTTPSPPVAEYGQGVTGQVLKLSGNHMPGPGRRGGPSQALCVPIHVFKGKLKPFKKPDRNHPKFVTVAHCQSDGIYKISLAPGEYTIVAEIDGRLYLNHYDGQGNWSTMKLPKGQWVTWTIRDTSQAAF